MSGSGTLGTSSSDAVTEQLLQSGSLGSTMGMPLPQVCSVQSGFRVYGSGFSLSVFPMPYSLHRICFDAGPSTFFQEWL